MHIFYFHRLAYLLEGNSVILSFNFFFISMIIIHRHPLNNFLLQYELLSTCLGGQFKIGSVMLFCLEIVFISPPYEELMWLEFKCSLFGEN